MSYQSVLRILWSVEGKHLARKLKSKHTFLLQPIIHARSEKKSALKTWKRKYFHQMRYHWIIRNAPTWRENNNVGYLLYQKYVDTNHHLGGVGFLVNRRIKHMVAHFIPYPREGHKHDTCICSDKYCRRYRSWTILWRYINRKSVEKSHFVVTLRSLRRICQKLWIKGEEQHRKYVCGLLQQWKPLFSRTFLMKSPQRKWTWRNPDNLTKNENNIFF